MKSGYQSHCMFNIRYVIVCIVSGYMCVLTISAFYLITRKPPSLTLMKMIICLLILEKIFVGQS